MIEFGVCFVIGGLIAAFIIYVIVGIFESIVDLFDIFF